MNYTAAGTNWGSSVPHLCGTGRRQRADFRTGQNFEAFRQDMYSIPLDGACLNIAVDDDGKSFYKLKIKVRDKIVADGLDDKSFDVTRRGGTSALKKSTG